MAIRQNFQDPFTVDKPILLRADLKESEDKVLLGHPGGPFNAGLLCHARQFTDFHFLKFNKIHIYVSVYAAFIRQ